VAQEGIETMTVG